MTLVCRTVLDLRSPLEKFVSQTLFLAASWHRHCRGHSRLEVLTVGGGNPVLEEFFAGIGASFRVIAPGENDDFSKSSNKIEAAYPDPAGHRLLLLDNDIVFFGGIRDLENLPADAIAASAPGALRVSDEQWSLIREVLDLPLIRRRFRSVNSRPLFGTQTGPGGVADDDPENYLYLNSGVVLFPAGHDHRASWKAHQRRIYEFFREHPLGNVPVTSSDQAGFASSIAAHGRFEWLPLRFNYRRGCFRLGMEPADRISMVHFTGDVPDGQPLGMEERIHAYWQLYVIPAVTKLPATIDSAERARRMDIALAVEANAVTTAREYALEDWLARYRVSRETPAPA